MATAGGRGRAAGRCRARARRHYWLRALNNACNLAIQHEGDDEARLRLAQRAIGFGARNIAIFHNAACVLCAVGALDEAVDAVAAAVDHGYGSATMVDDPDLDAIRHTEDFADAIGAARDADEAALNRQLATLRAELFMGGAAAPRRHRPLGRPGPGARRSRAGARGRLPRRPTHDLTEPGDRWAIIDADG